jgi:hypothetical protein
MTKFILLFTPRLFWIFSFLAMTRKSNLHPVHVYAIYRIQLIVFILNTFAVSTILLTL